MGSPFAATSVVDVSCHCGPTVELFFAGKNPEVQKGDDHLSCQVQVEICEFCTT